MVANTSGCAASAAGASSFPVGGGAATATRSASSCLRSAAASSWAIASSLMRVSSTPVPMLTVVTPRIRWSSELSRSTLRTRSRGAVTSCLLSQPDRRSNRVSVIR